MARKRAPHEDRTFADLVTESTSLPVESRTRPEDAELLRMPLDEDAWVDELGVRWAKPRPANLNRLKTLMADPQVRVIHASLPDERTEVEPKDRSALLHAVEDSWKGRDDYCNGWQNYSARVFKDGTGHSLVVVQQWCSPGPRQDPRR